MHMAKPPSVSFSSQFGAQLPERQLSILQAMQIAAQQIDEGYLPQAEAILRQILQQRPRHAGAIHLMGVLAHRAGKTGLGVDLIGKAIEIQSNSSQFHANRGEMCRILHRFDQAIYHGELAVALEPDNGRHHSNLGIAYFDKKDYVRAEACQHQALQFQPNLVQALNNLGNIRNELNDKDGAIKYYRRVLELAPNNHETMNNLSLALLDQGRLDEVEVCCRQALEIRPGFAEVYSTLLFALSHDPKVSVAELFLQHQEFERNFGRQHRVTWLPHDNNRDPLRRLKIGFVSGDLRNHAVAHFIEPVWRELDRQQLEIVAYSVYPTEDKQTGRLKMLSDNWVNASLLSDADLAARIRTDRIDILFDLSGHTAFNRLQVFARKPAPVQVAWIGYPHTTGLHAMDYRISDPYRMPPGMEAQFVEKVVRMPTCGTFSNLTDAPPVNPLPALGSGAVTFGSFQRPGKLGEATLELWRKVLNAVPDSRMLIGAIEGRSLKSRLCDYFDARGISTSRLEFYPKLSKNDYLSLHHKVDILLDTYPFPGGTTANHGMIMGVPTLTMTGKSPASWQCAAILMRLGMDDWVAHDEAAFVARAQYWAAHLTELANLRSVLRQHFMDSPLNRPESVARGLEAALRIMWKRWCAGQAAENFQVDP